MESPNDTGALATNKVFQTLQCFEPSDCRRLLKYLKSPYFNQSKTLTTLGEAMLTCLEQGRDGFDRHALWAQLFPDAPYDDVNFRKYCSDLLKLVEDFMAQESIMADSGRRKTDLLEFVVRRKIEPLYTSTFRDARKEFSGPYRSLEHFRNRYALERLYYEMMDFDVKLNVKANLEEISFNLDMFYWIEKLKLYASVLSQKRTGNFDYKLQFNEEIFEFLQKTPLEDLPELAIYYYSLLTLFEEGTDEHYFQLKKLLGQYAPSMPQKEAIELFDSALHYCTGKVNQGNRTFMKEYFDLFEEGLDKGIFIVNGELADWRFNNAIAAALRLRNFDWAEKFVEKYKDFLPEEARKNTYTFSLARVYRYQRKYDQVLALLRNIEYEDIGYNLISKTMLINTYYELGEHDALQSFVESFRTFLNRHKGISQKRKKRYLNMLKHLRRLTRIKPGDHGAIAKLREEVAMEKSDTVNQLWLLEKLSELEQA